ncbi:glutamate-cysteine ligase family protein [Colwellia sp. MEBiC06753]
MGTAINKGTFTKQDYQQFKQKLYQQLETLNTILARPNFGDAPLKIGAELEMYLTGNSGNVSFTNQFLLQQLNDSQFQPELNQYNLELNLSAFLHSQQPLSQLHQEIKQKTEQLHEVAQAHNITPVAIGILPTLEKHHLSVEYMTKLTRYQSLANHLYQERGEAFSVNINGQESLKIAFNDICAEGANTSFQVHLMVKPERFVSVFNAAQLTAPLVAAIAANSPILLGKKLWHETRIALFKQSLDIRARDKVNWQEPTRVNFGFGWLRHSPWQLFAEAVSLYPVILPAITEEAENTDGTTLPPLNELNLHMGTLWPWHRPVYSNQGNGHIRIEFRAIPAGPSAIDMVANAAFAIGLANGLADNIERLISLIPFRYAEYNFYRAAQYGLNANILWPLNNKYRCEEVAISDVLQTLVPIASKGLTDLGIDAAESAQYLAVIQQRLDNQQNGAQWQLDKLAQLEQQFDFQTACQQLVKSYQQHSRIDMPVSQWEL